MRDPPLLDLFVRQPPASFDTPWRTPLRVRSVVHRRGAGVTELAGRAAHDDLYLESIWSTASGCSMSRMPRRSQDLGPTEDLVRTSQGAQLRWQDDDIKAEGYGCRRTRLPFVQVGAGKGKRH